MTPPASRSARMCGVLAVLLLYVLTHASLAVAQGAEADPSPGDDPVPTVEENGSQEDGGEEAASPPARDPRLVAAPPVGVRFGRPIEFGERLRVSYTYERIKQQGLMIGDRDTTPSIVRNELPIDYVTTPRKLNTTVHDFQLGYSPHPRVTLIVEVPFIVKELQTLEESGARFENQTEGVGDIGFGLIVPFIKKAHEQSHVHILFDVPTGSIRRGGRNSRLPYDNQIGNGTWDFEWGWTYRGDWRRLTWGGQAVGRHPIRRNGLQYREGSRFEVSAWTGFRLFAGLSASLRMGWTKQNNISGQDDGLAPIEDPSENDKARGGTRIDLSPGVQLVLPQLSHQRLSVELDVPVYQDLDGPQLRRAWSLKAGWQWDF